MNEIKVKKENVLKAWGIAKIHYGAHDSQIFKALFPEAFEEENKETELKKILNLYNEHFIARGEAERRIRDLAKKKVDEAWKNTDRFCMDTVKQKLDEM